MLIEIGILTTAFTLQLLALPGEKGQFIISALSTKYRPVAVAIGASMAFGLWTVVEIIVGKELKGVVSEDFVEGATAMLLVLFAILIIYEIRNGDSETSMGDNKYYKKVANYVPDKIEGGVMAFLVMLFGEFGDKTQLITIGLAAKYGTSWEIWAGEMLAIIPVTFLNAMVISGFVEKYDNTKIKYAASVLLILFALDIFISQVTGFSLLPF